MYEKILEAVDFIADRVSTRPKIAITLGSGLGSLIKELKVEIEIPYAEIPNFPVSTVKGHRGALLFGTINNVEVAVFSGRFHYYEGYPMQQIAIPIRVMKLLGVEKWIQSNAAGGVNPSFKVGDVMIINDHINLLANNPLIGKNDDRFGLRFPDMSEAYNKEMIKTAFQCAQELNIHLQEGVYAALSGPCFETPAEYNMLYVLGADATGMSTVPETIVARHCGIKMFAFSVISNLGFKSRENAPTHEEVLEETKKTEPKLQKLIFEMLPKL